MSAPHDPWAAGPSPSPEPAGRPPGVPETSATPTDQTVIRDSDATYLRPTSPPNHQQTPNYQQQNYQQAPNYPQPNYQQPNYPQSNYPQPPAYAPAPNYAPAPPISSYGPGYGGPAAGTYIPPGGYAAASHPPKPGRKRPLIIGLCVLLLVVVGTAGWLVLRPSSAPAFTFAGKRIANADAVLTTAQTTTAGLVTSRHGASNSDTRCYFARPTSPAKGAKKTDIGSTMYCGPVLFVDGDKTQEYLSYALTPTGTKSGATTLAVSTTPATQDPGAAPAGSTLMRPDKLTPDSTLTLAVPAPPPAAAGLFTTSPDLAGQTVPAAPAGAVMGSRYGSVRLTNLGRLTRYGHGDAARSAPTGQKLVAFQLASGPTDSGTAAAFPFGTLSVGVAGQTHTVPYSTKPVLVAVPDSATTANLVLSDSGVTQTISLLTGRTGASNIAVDRRTHHTGPASAVQTIGFKESAPGASITRTAHVHVYSSGLRYWVNLSASDARHAASPGTALLNVRLLYTFTGPPKSPFTSTGPLGPFAFDPKMISLHLPNGQVVAARNYATGSLVYIMFPVPASYTTGRVYISGQVTNTHNVTFSVPRPISFAVTIPVG